MWESLLSFLFLEKEMTSLSGFLYPAGWGGVGVGVGGCLKRSVLYPGTDSYNHGWSFSSPIGWGRSAPRAGGILR